VKRIDTRRRMVSHHSLEDSNELHGHVSFIHVIVQGHH